MTTPQPAALPEHSAAIEQLKMAAANFENAASVPNVPNAGDYAKKAREIRASIAALQSQPAAPGVTGAVQTLIETLKADPEYAWAWHCNVAMAAVDEGLSHYAANKAAARFLSWLAQIDTTTHLGFPKAPEQPANAGVFAKWWNTQGQSMQQHASESTEDFARRIAAWAWSESARSLSPAQPAAAAAGVSDEVIWRLWDSQERTGMVGGPCPVKFACAILALRPQAVPMTEAELIACVVKANCLGGVPMTNTNGHYHIDTPSDAVVRLKDAIESHHGITAQGAQGGEG